MTYGETLTVLKLAVLANPSMWPFAAAALEEAIEGDGSTIKAAAAIADSDEFRIGVQEQSVALICADSPARGSWIASKASAALADRWWAGWPVPLRVLADHQHRPLHRPMGRHHQNPILVIGTRFDPTTPLRNARLAERRLGNAVLLIHDGYGHLTRRDPSTCITQAHGQLPGQPHHPTLWTVCPADRLPFDPDFG